jgi:hypothetical protein
MHGLLPHKTLSYRLAAVCQDATLLFSVSMARKLESNQPNALVAAKQFVLLAVL